MLYSYILILCNIDVTAWLRSLRLHKYNSIFENMRWQDMIKLDDQALQQKGIAALGARRKMLKVFENVREHCRANVSLFFWSLSFVYPFTLIHPSFIAYRILILYFPTLTQSQLKINYPIHIQNIYKIIKKMYRIHILFFVFLNLFFWLSTVIFS